MQAIVRAARRGALLAVLCATATPTLAQGQLNVICPVQAEWCNLAAVAVGGRLWALGGRASFFGTQYANVEVYDPATDSWRVGVPLPEGRGGLAATVLGDRVYVFGGEAPLRIFNANEMYEATGQRWIAKAAMPTPRHGIGAVAVNGRIYIAGGATSPGFARTDVHEEYAP